jgi:flagellar M-ring protein FliF
MEPLLKQLRQLPGTLSALPASLKAALVVGILAVAGAAVYATVSGAEAFPYAFTNLTPEDSSEAAATLKAAGIPFRVDAGGSALAVPASRMYDARLLLASAGLPRGGGVGFEIFDRGDLGVSEFTQRVNLRRATEGELARTISRLSEVRSARVHVTLPERGLYRDQDRPASAAVVLNLQPGRKIAERELAGIRHLVASAVPGLDPSKVTVVDGRGQALASEDGTGEAFEATRRLERDLEQRVVGILGQAVGAGAVVARVTATMDASEVQRSAESYDPDAAALRSERRVSQQTSGEGPGSGGVAGAAANQPLAQTPPVAAGGRGRATSTMEDQVRNYDVSKTTTTTVTRVPRLQRLSMAVLVDGVSGQPRPDAELKRLGDLAKRAVGFDAERGDEFDITSAPFSRSEEEGGEKAAAAPVPVLQRPTTLVAAAAGGLLLLLVVAALLLRRRAPAAVVAPLLTPGARVAEIEAALARDASALAAGPGRPALQDPASTLRDRARELAAKDPTRAATILKAWMAQENPAPRSTPHA